jgi:hypothetical protein
MADGKKPPPKPPKIAAPRDRDVFVPKRQTSPYGTPIVTDPKHRDTGEQWPITEDTGARELMAPQASSGRDDDTPIGLEVQDAEAEFRLRNRVKETNLNVRSMRANAESASSGVATLRMEVQGHVERIDKSIASVKTEAKAGLDALSGKVDALGGDVRDATGAVIDAVSTLNNFQGMVVKSQLEERNITWEAHTEVKANQQKLADKNKADAQKQARSFRYSAGALVLKILGAGGVVAATAIATHYAERC